VNLRTDFLMYGISNVYSDGALKAQAGYPTLDGNVRHTLAHSIQIGSKFSYCDEGRIYV
jgi:hypothetical protein